MKISYQWLREWVAVKLDPRLLADRLTLAGLEVGAVEPVAPSLKNIVVGRVLQVSPHPAADRLKLCKVDAGHKRIVSIVCGAPNVAAGMLVPVALRGASLPSGQAIEETEVRGVKSEGMLCSAAELGLAESSNGLLDLGPHAPVGQLVVGALGLNDVTLEVELTPNRGDCLGIAGLAREVSALTGKPVRGPRIGPVRATSRMRINVVLEDPHGCPRYVGRVIDGINPGATTPLWMQERLRRSGIRSIHPVVDVTNYVMIELGQPMHAFDLARLHGGVRVRKSRAGESLTLLDGKQIELPEGALLIADDAHALALAGIMGGEDSGVGSDTRAIFLESAFFSPEAIAGRARTLGLHTESSHRFERGVDPSLQRMAIERATRLLLDIVGGRPGPIVEKTSAKHLPRSPVIRLRAARIERVLGVKLADKDVPALLKRLGLRVAKDRGGWKITPPSHRFDIVREEDLIEELARLHGYDKIPSRLPDLAIPSPVDSETRVSESRLRAALVDRDYREVVTYSFVDPALNRLIDPAIEPVALANPISPDMAVMRTSLWPGLLSTVKYNLNRQQSRVRIFEIGRCFVQNGKRLIQDRRLAGMVCGTAAAEQWGMPARPVDFHDVRADIEALVSLSGRSAVLTFEKTSSHPALHPGQAARIVLDGQAVGFMGTLHPNVQENIGLTAGTILFEMDFEHIMYAKVPIASEISRFPSVRRDIAIVIDDNIPAEAVLSEIRTVAGILLENLELFDQYHGKGIDSGRKSFALALTLRGSSRTLTEREVEQIMGRVVGALESKFGARLRG